MKIVDNKTYGKFLKGKKVVLVGPSWENKGSNLGKLIDSYDVVVRMNMGMSYSNKLEKDMGRRTDILYCSMGKYFFKNGSILTKPNLPKLDGKVKWIIGTGHHIGGLEILMKNDNDFNISLSKVDSEVFKKVSSKFKKKLAAVLLPFLIF